MIEFVYFDVGGTLLRDQMSQEQAFHYALDQAGLAFAFEEVRAACRKAHQALSEAFLQRSLAEAESPKFFNHSL